MTRNFREMLEAKWAEGKFVCVGLDSDHDKIQPYVRIPHELSMPGMSVVLGRTVGFNAAIIEATKDIASCYKPNFAFYLKHGVDGLGALRWAVGDIRRLAPDVPVILDMKDADIGNTNNGYVQFVFDELQADAVTVNPYLGAEAMKPFLERKDKGIIVLCRTSNPGADEFQDAQITVTKEMYERLLFTQEMEYDRFWVPKTMPLYQYVAYRVASSQWNANNNCCLVVGATVPAELAAVRAIVGDMPILIPGIGAQGGDLEKTVAAGKDSRGRGMIVNSSRGIIFASDGPDFAEAARRETKKLHDQIRACLNL